MGMDLEEIAIIASAVGNHEEEYGFPVNNVAAAVILADKTDVHRTRVKNKDVMNFDIHDRVSYAAIKSFLDVSKDDMMITLSLTIENDICPVMEYFEIFMNLSLIHIFRQQESSRTSGRGRTYIRKRKGKRIYPHRRDRRIRPDNRHVQLGEEGHEGGH